MASNITCTGCDSIGLNKPATRRVVMDTVVLYLCRDHAEGYASDPRLRRWEAA